MATPPHIERAANRAAVKVKQLIIEMMMAQQLGSVAVEVTPDGLQPVKYTEDRQKTIKFGRADSTTIKVLE